MASRFWVGGTGTWDASTTTPWAATSGGAGGQSVPGSSDDVTIDASSGAGTITVNTNFNVSSLTTGAMGMTLDFGTNNNSPTINGSSGWSNSGTGTRTINLGSGTFTISGTGVNGLVWGTSTNLTLGANTATIALSGNTTNDRAVQLPNANVSNMPSISIAGNSSRGGWSVSGAGTMTIPLLTITAPNHIVWSSSTTTLTNLTLSGGSVSSPISWISNTIGSQVTIPLTNSATGSGLVMRCINPTTGTITGSNSIDLGRNGANVILTAPSGSGVVGVIGG